MSESKFTPGSWVAQMVRHAPIEKEFGCYLLCDEKISNLALVSSWMDSPSHAEEAEANAKLIASAPCLLKELTVIRETLPHVGLDAATRVEMLRRIDAVIAKATI